jgi:hypothetical protein
VSSQRRGRQFDPDQLHGRSESVPLQAGRSSVPCPTADAVRQAGILISSTKNLEIADCKLKIGDMRVLIILNLQKAAISRQSRRNALKFHQKLYVTNGKK